MALGHQHAPGLCQAQLQYLKGGRIHIAHDKSRVQQTFLDVLADAVGVLGDQMEMHARV